MLTDNLLFLLARIVMIVLCAGAAIYALLHMRRRTRGGGQPPPVIGLIATLLGLGLALAIHDAWDNVLRDWTTPITFGSWLWLVFDLGVPLLAIRVLRVMAQRDQALDQLAALAATDPLTGLANRRGFEGRAAVVITTARRDGLPCTLLAFDIDRFKSINDGWGHPAGDAVLRETATTLAETLRAGDVLGRMGGEEFAAVLRGVDPRAAALMAERLRRAVREAARHPGGGDAVVTLSCGIAPIASGPPPLAALNAALDAADAALYAAKRNGRDRVELAAA